MEITMVLTERGKDNWDKVRAVLKESMEEAGIDDVEVQETMIRDDEEAMAVRCIGSPTIRVNGYDVEYMEREPDERSAGVRYYNTPAGWKPVPEKGMIVRSLQKAKEMEAGT
ncbi:MAG: hypothetical protein WD058_05920 [Dehalococcoidia bacterium]